jgi:L-alanine-DL-glutamate epimerase-like enolase superfamily enzyme
MLLRYRPIELTLSEPFVTHKEVKPARIKNLLVEIEWQGLTGVGVAVPAKDYGMTESTLRAALDEYAVLLEGTTPFQLEQIVDRLETRLSGQPSAIAAIDMALHDLLGKVAGLPVYRLLGLDGLPVPDTAMSLGLMSPDEAAEKAAALSQWATLKLKMSAVPDYALVRAVRDAFPGRICVDGNGAWHPKQAVAIAEELARHGVTMLEQPIPAGNPEGLRFIRERAPLLIFADEDCAGPAEILGLQGCVDGINVKLLKCGGLRRALKMIWLARQSGLQVMLGCKVESAIGTTAMAHLGGLADFLDLDGHLCLLDDPYTGIAVENGRVTLPDAPGLGLRPAHPLH